MRISKGVEYFKGVEDFKKSGAKYPPPMDFESEADRFSYVEGWLDARMATILPKHFPMPSDSCNRNNPDPDPSV